MSCDPWEIRKQVYALVFALVLLAAPIHLLILGALNIASSSPVTGAFHIGLITSLIVIGLLARPVYTPTVLDVVFAIFFGCAIISMILHFDTEHAKEYVIFGAFSAGTFLAGRLLPTGAINYLKNCVLWISAAVALVACAVMLPSLIQAWGVHLARPQVFGFPHTVAHFTYATGVLALAITARSDRKMSWNDDALLLTLLAVATLMLSLSLVRFTFAAITVFFWCCGYSGASHALTWRDWVP